MGRKATSKGVGMLGFLTYMSIGLLALAAFGYILCVVSSIAVNDSRRDASRTGEIRNRDSRKAEARSRATKTPKYLAF